MFFYAQLDENSICVGLSQLSGRVEAENMIAIEIYDASLLGKQYDNGAWADVMQEENETPEPQPTENQIIMQTLADVELRNIETQQNMQILAQQMTDLELMMLERGNE